MLPTKHDRLMKDYPDHEDANLVLRCYELRQEPVLRAARAEIIGKFAPASLDELLAVTGAGQPLNAPFRQVHTYWEMVYNFVRNGVVHAEFFVESNNGEGLYLLAALRPFLAEYRERVNPRACANAEWVATNTEAGKVMIARFDQRLQAARAAAGAR